MSASAASDGKLIDPRGRPFEIVFSKEHPGEKHAHGKDDDLLIPLAQKLDCVCYKYMFGSENAKKYGVLQPCPNAPLFANCDILFSDMLNPQSPNYVLYRAFVDWWTDVLARCILSAKIVHFNLAGYSKQRVNVITQRYQKLMKQENGVRRELQYEFIKELHSSTTYQLAPHLVFNTPWTRQELDEMNANENELYPGFTDWDLAFILFDPKLFAKTTFYNVMNIDELPALKPLTSEELLQYGIVVSADKKQ